MDNFKSAHIIHVIKKYSLPVIILCTLLLEPICLQVCASSAVVSVDPQSSAVLVTETFDININVTDVYNMTGWEFKLYYLNSILNCTAVTEGSFLKSFGSTFKVLGINNVYNATHGRVLAAVSLLGDVSANGSGVLAIVSFKAIHWGETVLDLVDTKLSDEKIPPQPITHTTFDGTVQVTLPVPAVSVDPQVSAALVTETFNVNINVTDVYNMTGWEFKLYYLNSVLNCTAVTEGPFLQSFGSTFKVLGINNVYNATHGRVLAAVSLLGNVSADGSGVLANVTFKAIHWGETVLDLVDTKLSDEKIPPQPITHLTFDGTVQVTLPPAEVSVSPSLLTGPAGWIDINATFSIDITVSGVGDLNYWQAGMSFNPTVLYCINFTEGPFLSTGGDTTWQIGNIDNEQGIITPYGAALIESTGVSGNGTLASVTFKVKSTGVSSLLLEDVILLDPDYERISTTVQSGYFELPSPVPKPPNAYFNYYPTTPYVNQTVTFNASESTPNGGIIITYEWNFDDGYQGQGMIITHMYTDPGEYNVTLIVTDDENLTGNFTRHVIILAILPGAFVDVYTQRDGKGINKSSDAFAPDQLMIISAYLTYNGAPLADRLVTFNMYLPNNTLIWSRTSETDDDGLTSAAYLIRSSPVFGQYTIDAITTVGGQLVSDSLRFKVGWLIQILEATPCNIRGVAKSHFAKGEPSYLRLRMQNIRFYSTKTTIAATVFDELLQPIIFETAEYIILPNETTIILYLGTIPQWAYVGTATVSVVNLQWLGGPAYCPEAETWFMITPAIPDVAVVGIETSHTEASVGQSINISVSVLNEYYKPLSFNLTVYANTNVIQIIRIDNLTPFTETNFTFIWDTYPVSPGYYTISARAETVSGEVDTADNVCTGPTIRIIPKTNPTHDIAITGTKSSKDIVGQTYPLRFEVTVQNQGDYEESISLIVYDGTTVVQTENLTLSSGSSTTVTFSLNTTSLLKGNHTLRAFVAPVSGETDFADNTRIYGTIYVGIPGDIAATYGLVDMKDIGTAVKAFGSVPGHSRWNANADINDDIKVDMKDIGIAIKHFGQSIP